MLVIRNEALLDLLRPSYRRGDVRRLLEFLHRKGTFEFQRLPNGLYPAAAGAAEDDASGYQNAWVRDNVHIAHAHFVWGERAAAAQTVQALMGFFEGERRRMQRIVQHPSLAGDPMQRPHVRFDARRIQELTEKWPHAQNDALGYFLWFYSLMATHGLVAVGEEALATLADLLCYLHAIQYWRDPDSGHWEEARKIGAASIGTVLAGLRAFAGLCNARGLYAAPALATRHLDDAWMAALTASGERELQRILPWESLGPAPAERRYDAALLFLIYPLEIVAGSMADRIVTDVTTVLGGPMGIRRYLLDSYWCADYRTRFSAQERSADFSQSLKARDRHIRPGEEAQWCLFDPLIACIYGARGAAGQPAAVETLGLQSHYLNRALGQLTEEKGGGGSWQCPEAYFLENGVYVPNDHTPLQWTQANLRLALHWMERTAPL